MMWSGVRGTVAITGGRYAFSVRLLRSLPVAGVAPHPAGPGSGETEPAVRVGVSFPTADVGMLGEAPGSWAFSSAGSVAGDGCEPAPYAWELKIGDEVLRWHNAHTQRGSCCHQHGLHFAMREHVQLGTVYCPMLCVL